MKTTRALRRLPATIPELAALEGVSVHYMNAVMQTLKQQGRAIRTDRKAQRHNTRGPAPYIWERSPSKHSLTSPKEGA